MQSRVRKHVLRWFQNQLVLNASIKMGNRKPCSSIAKHIIEMRHRMDINTVFRMLYRKCQERILRLLEVLTIIIYGYVITLDFP